MHKSEIEELIEQYETEKQTLEKLISDQLSPYETDYLMAHHYQEALNETNHKLRVLYKLNDPFYEQKENLNRQKKSLDKVRKEFESYENPGINEYLDSKIEKIDKELSSLNNAPRPILKEGQEFDDAIYDLIEGKVSMFRLVLQKEKRLYVEFKMIGRMIIISLTPAGVLSEEDQYLINESYYSQKLTHIGFVSNEKEGPQYNYDLTTFKNSIAIKTLVARVIFEVYEPEMDKQTFIEYH